MTEFGRHFAGERLQSPHRTSAGVRHLFSRWALPGEDAGMTGLRIGIRAGYLNFYVKGQSVAKLSFDARGPVVEVHPVYNRGCKKDEARPDGEPLTRYVAVNAAALDAADIVTRIDRWIETAESYASAEKRFVDALVAANPGVIDLEMGLPASDQPGSDRVAPRMDLVVAELADGGAPAIAFWEAKCANNPELRAQADYEERGDGSFTGPKVLHQIGKYVRWMEQDGRVDQVKAAYHNTAAILLDLHRLFRGEAGDTPACVRVWQIVAAAEALQLVVRPGIVIANEWPEGSQEPVASDRMRQAAASFARNGHRHKLTKNDVRVHEVGADGREHVLPPLAGGAAHA